MRRLVILGATGSIGASTLDICARHPDRFEVLGLAGHSNADAMIAACRRSGAAHVAMVDPAAAAKVAEALGSAVRVTVGTEAVAELAALDDADTVVAAIVGTAGLLPTLSAIRRGRRILLATKEALVTAGAAVMSAVTRHGAEILPLDSEHNAIFQCLPAQTRCGERPAGVRRMILTASGGPFRQHSLDALATVTPDQAVAHPNWDMGRKISVDSATMMNKGLELIEAAWLFGMPAADLEVVVHPQSTIHSLVEFEDHSVLAQLGAPDMRIPIAHALAHPERVSTPAARLDLTALGRLDFEPPDERRFPSLALARQALEAGGASAAVLNAANEVAVAAFLDRRIGFMNIAALVDTVLQRMASSGLGGTETLDDALAWDEWARRTAEEEALDA